MGLRKASAERFDRTADTIAEELGASPESHTGIDYYALPTKAGTLNLHASTRPQRGRASGLFTVFCKFEDVERARKLNLPHFNPHSGKYNFHMSGSDDSVDAALGSFRQHLERVL
jgi:hypothetical protein